MFTFTHPDRVIRVLNQGRISGSVAEWSKALVLGTSPQGRGFESHRCHMFYILLEHQHSSDKKYRFCSCSSVYIETITFHHFM